MTSWRPTAWQQRFISSVEPRVCLEGNEGCGKRRCLLEAAAVGHEDPLWRAVIICIGHDAKAALVRESGSVYPQRSAVYAAEFNSEWRFQTSGAIVRIADGIHEARAATGWDMVCLDHLEEFRDSEILETRRLLRRVPGRKPRLRATLRVDRDWRRRFPERITFEAGDDPDAFELEPSPEATDLERLVVAVTIYQIARSSGDAPGAWDRVIDAARMATALPRDAETDALVKAVEAKDGDERRLRVAAERARHRLAEMQGAEAGDCHPTCLSDCTIARSRAAYSVDITPR